MSPNLITLSPEAPLTLAHRLMRENEIRHIPVLHNGDIVGIVSDRDILKAMKTNRVNEWTIQSELSPDLKISDFMSWPVYTISESTSLERAISEMKLQRVSALVVQDAKGTPKGIVTTDDLLSHMLTLISESAPERSQLPIGYFTLY